MTKLLRLLFLIGLSLLIELSVKAQSIKWDKVPARERKIIYMNKVKAAMALISLSIEEKVEVGFLADSIDKSNLSARDLLRFTEMRWKLLQKSSDNEQEGIEQLKDASINYFYAIDDRWQEAKDKLQYYPKIH